MDRFFDIVFSGLALLILSPLLLPIVLILKFTGEGEIFFSQERIGKSGKVFYLFKFATMLKDSPVMGTGTVTMKGDPRVLPVGKFLRKSKINELPQLVNIFLGQISVIGPRPLTDQTFSLYSDETQKTLITVKPGLSGIGSVIFRGEEEIMYGATASVGFYKDVIAPYKGSLEKWFVANQRLYVYFVLIFLTIWVIIYPKTSAPWKVFKDLPEPPDSLKSHLNYTKD